MSIGRTGSPIAPRRSSRRSGTPSARACSSPSPAETSSRRATRLEVIAEIASRVPGAVSVAAVDRARAHAFYSATGSYIELAAPGGSGRGFGAAGFVFQQTFDPSFTDTFLLPPVAVRAPRFDVLGYIAVPGHVDGVAARRRHRRDADAAGHHRPGRDRRGAREDGDRSRHRRAATTRSASAWWMRARRCADWGWRSEDATLLLLSCLALASPAGAQDPPALSIRPFVMGAEQTFTASDTFDAVFETTRGPFFGGGVQVVIADQFVDRSRRVALQADWRARLPHRRRHRSSGSASR